MDDKDLLDELKERIKEGPVIFTPDKDFLDRLNPEDDIELYKDAIKDAADTVSYTHLRAHETSLHLE